MNAATRSGSTSAANRYWIASSVRHRVAVQAGGERRVEHFARHRAKAALVGVVLPVIALASRVRPWKPPVNAITAERPVAARATFTAFSGLGAGRQQDGLGRARKWGGFVQFFRQGDVAFIGADLERGVGEAFELRLHRRDHLGMAMPGVEHGNAPGKIDIAAPFHVPQLGILGAIGKDGGGRGHAARHGLFAAGKKGSVVGHRAHSGHEKGSSLSRTDGLRPKAH
jgi:hypothetical protein